MLHRDKHQEELLAKAVIDQHPDLEAEVIVEPVEVEWIPKAQCLNTKYLDKCDNKIHSNNQ